MVGLILFGILQGRSTLRQLEKLARTDVRAMWITGGIMPDHTVLCRFINRHRERLSGEFFEELSQGVVKRSGSSNETGAIDGTVVQAAASRYRTLRGEAAAELARQRRAAAEKEPGNAQLQGQAEAAEAAAAAAEKRIAARRRNGERNPQRVRVSVSEPEAVIQPLKGKMKAPSYKPSVIANEERIIVAQTVEPCSEQAVVGELLEQARKVTGKRLKRLIGDGNYFTSSVIAQVREAGVGSLVVPVGEEKEAGGERKYSKRAFRYDEEEDCYWCPAGHRLVPMQRRWQRGRRVTQYGRAPCGDCQLRRRCTSAVRGRTIRRCEDEAIKDEIREKMKRPEWRQASSRRKVMVEPVFSYLKERQGLSRFKGRGLKQVRLEFALYAAAYNLGRLLVIALGRESGGPEGSGFWTVFLIFVLSAPGNRFFCPRRRYPHDSRVPMAA